MKWLLILLLISAFASGQATRSAEHARDEQSILQLHDEWFKAFDAGDVRTMDRIESDDFTVVGDFGESAKQRQLDVIRQRSESQEVNRTSDNRQFRFYGDVALVTETDHYSSSSGTNDFQSTELWVRSGGSWKVVHLHFTQLAKKP